MWPWSGLTRAEGFSEQWAIDIDMRGTFRVDDKAKYQWIVNLTRIGDIVEYNVWRAASISKIQNGLPM